MVIQSNTIQNNIGTTVLQIPHNHHHLWWYQWMKSMKWKGRWVALSSERISETKRCFGWLAIVNGCYTASNSPLASTSTKTAKRCRQRRFVKPKASLLKCQSRSRCSLSSRKVSESDESLVIKYPTKDTKGDGSNGTKLLVWRSGVDSFMHWL